MSITVSGGSLRGRKLATLPGRDTRPTIGRVREAIFSILQHDIKGARVLDIFAGSGALAIEAVSRGAADAVLIENNTQAATVIRTNLDRCGLDLRLIVADFRVGLKTLAGEKAVFDLVFADPPYGRVLPEEMYRLLGEYQLMPAGGFLIMEHAGRLKPEGRAIVTTRRFGDSAITIYRYD
jgi:16S rRNA (guanine(966)-N(2))-methyltransferase RsmD